MQLINTYTIEIKKSKFIAYLYDIESVDDAKEALKQLKILNKSQISFFSQLRHLFTSFYSVTIILTLLSSAPIDMNASPKAGFLLFSLKNCNGISTIF